MLIKPNIIFLDVDGVICNPETCVAVGDVGGCFSYIDPVSCGLVKRLCTELNCKIVISSSWRLLFDKDSIQAILSAVCPQLGNYVHKDWRTIRDYDVERGMEIHEWIGRHSSEFNNFVILDDDHDMEPLLDNFVKTDAYSGFRFKDFIKARKILKGDENE